MASIVALEIKKAELERKLDNCTVGEYPQLAKDYSFVVDVLEAERAIRFPDPKTRIRIMQATAIVAEPKL